MSIAYWCILITAVLPYLWVSIAKAGGERYNNRDPRGWQARQENPRAKRAYAAQLNAYEAFPPFAKHQLIGNGQLSLVPPTLVFLQVIFICERNRPVEEPVFYSF